MRDLAAKVGISDVGLKKILRSNGIVTPPQGHWNRVHAGRSVSAPPAGGTRRPGETGRIALDDRFRGLIAETAEIAVRGPFRSPAVPEDLEELRAQELKVIGRVPVPRSLDKPHPGLAKLLKREEQNRTNTLEDRWHWRTPVFDTPLGQRQLRLLNGLLHALSRRDHSAAAWEQDQALHARCEIGDTSVSLTFGLVGKHRTELIAGFRRPARDLPASAGLRLSISREFRTDITTVWEDDSSGKLETKLAEIAVGVIVAGEAGFRQGLVEAAEWEEQHRKWEEERRKERLAALEAKRLANLKESGELLAKAEEIRALVARVKTAAIAGSTSIEPAELKEWERWALDYADRLDPVLSGQIFSHIRMPELP